MRHFFEAYPDKEKLSTLLRELPWSVHLEDQLRKRTSGVSGLHKQLTPTNGPKRADGLLPRLLAGQIDVEAMNNA